MGDRRAGAGRRNRPLSGRVRPRPSDLRVGRARAGRDAAMQRADGAVRGLSPPTVHRPRAAVRVPVGDWCAGVRAADGATPLSTSHVIATVLLVLGAALEVFAVLGLVVMRNEYDRVHYVGLAGYGALSIGIAILVQESFSLIGDKALATGVVLLVIGPVLTHTT